MVLSRLTKVGMAMSTLTLACAQAHADNSAFRFSGFGTVGGVITDNSDVEFATPGQPSGAKKSLDLGVDSRIGVQGSYQLNDMFSGTVQVISKYNGKGNYNPNVEWAFVKAQITPTVGVRAGRIGAPYFMISDYRDVNYANLWVRPPLETYGQVPVSNVTGADLIVQQAVGSANVSAQLWGGLSRATLEDQTDVTIRDQVGLSLSAEFDNGLTLRAGHAVGKVSLGSDNLRLLAARTATAATTINASVLAAQYGAAASATADDFDMSGRRATFSGVGASWDVGNWQLNAEYTRRFIDGYVGSSKGWYASAGYRMGKVTPFAYVAGLQVSGVASNGLAAPSAAITALAPLSAAINTVLNDARTGGQRSVALGARWDAWKSASLKAQLEHITPKDGGVGLFVANPGASLNGDSVNVLSVSVDFVF
jgi:predicted porin